MAVRRINTTKLYRKITGLIFALHLDPRDAPIKLPNIVKAVTIIGIWPVDILPITPPMAEMNTIASEDAMVVRVGILSTVNIMGIK